MASLRPLSLLLRSCRPIGALARSKVPAAPARRFRPVAAHPATDAEGSEPTPPSLLARQLIQASSCAQLSALLPSVIQAGQADAALLAAARLGCAADMRALLAAGANSCCCDSQGLAPLHLAAAAGAEACVALLLDAGAQADQRDKLQRTPAMLCVLRGHGGGGIPRRLVAAGASVHSCCAYGHTPLILAGALGDVAAVRELLDLGSDPMKTDSSGLTPRAAAARRSAREVLPDEADLADHPPGQPGGPDFAAVERLLEVAERAACTPPPET